MISYECTFCREQKKKGCNLKASRILPTFILTLIGGSVDEWLDEKDDLDILEIMKTSPVQGQKERESCSDLICKGWPEK